MGVEVKAAQQGHWQGAMVWRSRRDLEIVTSGVELPTPRWASWTKEEHRVSYSLLGVGVLRPWVRTQGYFKQTLTGVRVWISRSIGCTG